MKTNVYIDGFNLYYAIKGFKNPCYKWLDLAALCDRTLKGHTIGRIRYFTARVRARPEDPDQQLRQQVYLRALGTIPNLTIHEGYFLNSTKWSLLVKSPPGLAEFPDVIEKHKRTGALLAHVIKVEEKGSDVNIATHLLLDGFRKDYELAVIISNDSDLVEPIMVARNELGLQVGVLNPHRNTSFALQQAANFYRPIRQGALKASQFPDVITTGSGDITKPIEW
jgi:uncharacterized LabA/DUF88 family protein